MDWVRWHWIDVQVTDAYEGESLTHDPLQDGDVVVDRGYNPAQALIAWADRGAGVVVRYNPPSWNGYDETQTKIDGYEELQKTVETERCVPVRVQVNGPFIEAYVHACRLPPVPAASAGPG